MPAIPRDRPADIRPGEELDVDRLSAYLREHVPGLDGEVTVAQFPRGFSNLTYLLRIGERDVVLRRPPHGAAIQSAHDMGREHTVLSRLHPVYDKVPEPIAYCDDPAVLGAPFYLMERIDGAILRAGLPPDATPGPRRMAAIASSFVETFASLHAVDIDAAGLADFGRPVGYVGRQIGGWTRRWQRARIDDVPDIERTASWLHDHAPDDGPAALIHNDFKYDNLLLDPVDGTRVVAVLDWEMATLGDPRMDLGTSLGYWIDPDDHPAMLAVALSPTVLPGNPTRSEVAQGYAAATGLDLGDLVFYYVYGLFKIAVIVQQIYARYRQGHTRDPRFARLDQAVLAFGLAAVQAIDRRRIDNLFGTS